VFHYSRNRDGEHPSLHLAGNAGSSRPSLMARSMGFTSQSKSAADYRGGVLEAQAAEILCPGRPCQVALARNMGHCSRLNQWPHGSSPCAEGHRFDTIFAIEREINGLSAEQRLAVRTTRFASLVCELERLDAQ
jgi:transposase